MVKKLYPPILENVLPACYRDSQGMVTITIPFSMNRSVSALEVGGFELKIKTIQTGTYLYTFTVTNPNSYSINEQECYVTFQIKDEDNKLKIGQFYKIQLAYISVDAGTKSSQEAKFALGEISLEEYEAEILKDSIVGFYSTTGTIKYTTKPKLYINNYSANRVNTYSHIFTGYYDQTEGDITEKVYSYCFNIYDKNNNIVYTSNESIHNSTDDSANNFGMSYDVFNLFVDFEYDVLYYIDYTVTTINNLVLSSPKYRIIQRETVDPEIHADLEAELNFDNGYITLKLIPQTDPPSLDTGSFVISRADEDSNFTNWEELFKFKLYKDKPEGIIYKDFTFQQGRRYQYSLQQYNDYDLYSKRILSNIVLGDFEDGFLYDGERQLKVRYNMKMSKFTNNVLESKQETIGSQYPFFFRNGTVNYNEFPIGGLISYFMDEEHLFMTEDQLITDEKTINYTTDNLAQERIFKMEVLNWLNDGKPKLLRTPTEGNFIVRLMKVSLSPEDKLGRLLHNFSCTAYEIADYNSANLRQLNMLNIGDKDLFVAQWKSIDLSAHSVLNTITIRNDQDAPMTSLHFEGMLPGDVIKLTFKDRVQQEIIIGATGSYYIDNVELPIRTISFTPRYQLVSKLLREDFNTQDYYIYINGAYKHPEEYDPLMSYYIISNPKMTGIMTYGYSVKRDNSYAHIESVSYNDSVFKQFIGEHDILQELQKVENLPNIKSELMNISYIKVSKRPVDNVTSEFIDQTTHADNGEYYFGALNSAQENRSERTPKVELMYPIGLRAYEPNTYYIKDGNSYKLDPYDYWRAGVTYYLKGQYRPPDYPIGRVSWTPDSFYVIRNGKYEKDTEGRWIKGETYYEQHRTQKGVIYYTEVPYVTANDDHIYKDNKFYRKATPIDGDSNIYFTIARKFYPDFYNNHTTLNRTADQYYILDPALDGYVEAYVTLNTNYVYSAYNYYVHIENDHEAYPDYHKDVYQISSEVEFNVHDIKKQPGDIIEYENKVLKYYKIKEILPHILHRVGNEWIKDESGREGYPADLYHFDPVKYKDLYNGGKDYDLDEYAPYVRINGEIISVNDTVEFGPKDLTIFGEITDLYAGNGVVVDIVYATKEYSYIVERTKNLNSAYLNALDSYHEAIKNLHLDQVEDEKDYVDLSDISHSSYTSYYNNTYQNAVQRAYKGLVADIISSMGGA